MLRACLLLSICISAAVKGGWMERATPFDDVITCYWKILHPAPLHYARNICSLGENTRLIIAIHFTKPA